MQIVDAHQHVGSLSNVISYHGAPDDEPSVEEDSVSR